jgi:hypothetical protein
MKTVVLRQAATEIVRLTDIESAGAVLQHIYPEWAIRRIKLPRQGSNLGHAD